MLKTSEKQYFLAGLTDWNGHFAISDGFCSSAVGDRPRPSTRVYMELCDENPVDDNGTKRHACFEISEILNLCQNGTLDSAFSDAVGFNTRPHPSHLPGARSSLRAA